ncbi:hypothetical protein M406DRAFT_243438, partial [Cryphonectria parasitica EP155]
NSLPALTSKPPGHPHYLELWEDEALVRYVMQLDSSNFPSLRPMLIAAANSM